MSNGGGFHHHQQQQQQHGFLYPPRFFFSQISSFLFTEETLFLFRTVCSKWRRITSTLGNEVPLLRLQSCYTYANAEKEDNDRWDGFLAFVVEKKWKFEQAEVEIPHNAVWQQLVVNTEHSLRLLLNDSHGDCRCGWGTDAHMLLSVHVRLPSTLRKLDVFAVVLPTTKAAFNQKTDRITLECIADQCPLLEVLHVKLENGVLAPFCESRAFPHLKDLFVELYDNDTVDFGDIARAMPSLESLFIRNLPRIFLPSLLPIPHLLKLSIIAPKDATVPLVQSEFTAIAHISSRLQTLWVTGFRLRSIDVRALVSASSEIAASLRDLTLWVDASEMSCWYPEFGRHLPLLTTLRTTGQGHVDGLRYALDFGVDFPSDHARISNSDTDAQLRLLAQLSWLEVPFGDVRICSYGSAALTEVSLTNEMPPGCTAMTLTPLAHLTALRSLSVEAALVDEAMPLKFWQTAAFAATLRTLVLKSCKRLHVQTLAAIAQCCVRLDTLELEELNEALIRETDLDVLCKSSSIRMLKLGFVGELKRDQAKEKEEEEHDGDGGDADQDTSSESHTETAMVQSLEKLIPLKSLCQLSIPSDGVTHLAVETFRASRFDVAVLRT